MAGAWLDPRNGFFDAMLAVAAFAREHDGEALRHLHTAAGKPVWNDRASDEVRAEWKLLRAAYGDRGALQAVALPSGLLVPHFAALRAAARLAARLATERERAGDYTGARSICNDVMRLGLRLQDQSPSLIGKQVGQAIFYTGMAPGMKEPSKQPTVSAEDRRRRARDGYAADLEAHGDISGAAWVRYESERAEALYARIRRAAASPDYWPLRSGPHLAAWWEFGLVLLEQMVVLLCLWGGLALLGRLLDRKEEGAVVACSARWLKVGPLSIGPWTVVYLVLFVAPIVVSMLVFGVEIDSWIDLWPFVPGVFLTGLLDLARYVGKCRQLRAASSLCSCDERQACRGPALMALAIATVPMTLVVPVCILISPVINVFGLSEPYQALGQIGFASALALIPAMLLAYLALCRAALLGLPPLIGTCRGVRQAAPYAVAFLMLLFIAAAGPTDRADRTITQQIEQSLVDELGALEALPPG
jgi:hypothetical protein